MDFSASLREFINRSPASVHVPAALERVLDAAKLAPHRGRAPCQAWLRTPSNTHM